MTATVMMAVASSGRGEAVKAEGIQMTRHFGVVAAAGLALCLTMVTPPPSARAQMSETGAEVITNGPPVNPGYRSGVLVADQNLRDSERYRAAVWANLAFRATREIKECGPIDDAKMRADCLATFDR
jgi:hypothetical protein